MDELLKLPEFTWEEIQEHANEQSCWCVFHGLVYDLTKFLHRHPGSPHVILEVAGQDATDAFEDIGHSLDARVMANEFIVGRVKGAKNIRRCKKETAECCASPARANKPNTSASLIMIMVLVVLLGFWAYLHFQDDDMKVFQHVSTSQHRVVE